MRAPANGNLSGSAPSTFSFSAPGTGAALSAATCTTATTGAAAGTCSVTLTATKAGSYAITATLGGINAGGTNPVTGVFVAGAATAGSSQVAISTGPKVADGSDAYTITVTAYDANGNLNTNAASTFSFSAPGTGASLSANTCTTTAGTCSISLTATKAGSYSVTTTFGTTQVGGTNPVVGVFVAGAVTASTARLSISDGPRLADGVDTYTLTASALDAQGNLSAGSATTFSFDTPQPAPGALLSAGTCTTATSGPDAGRCSLSLKATTAGSYSVQARLDGRLIGGSNPATAVFVAGSPSAAASRLDTRQADGVDAHTVTITARDAFDNVQGDVSTLFTFSPPVAGGSLSAPSCSTATTGAEAGSCSVTLKANTPGSYTVSGSLGGQSVGNNPVQGQFVSPGAAAVTAVPTLSEWGCMGLALSLGLLGAVSRGRQRHRKSSTSAHHKLF